MTDCRSANTTTPRRDEEDYKIPTAPSANRKAEEKRLLRRLHKSYDLRAKKRLAAIAAKAD
ncbi:MAG: hypothetical protein RIT81_34235 [Deltaproteobacteria bacterium]